MYDMERLSNSVKKVFYEFLGDDPDIDMNVLTQSFMNSYEEIEYSITGTFPLLLNDGKRGYIVFIEIYPNGELFIIDITPEN